MTDIEKAVAISLRLSEDAAIELNDVIKRLIDTARAELIRSGISAEVANDDSNNLVVDAIICFCQYKMADDKDCDRYFNSFTYQQENLRKS